MSSEIKTTYTLEMCHPDELTPRHAVRADLTISRMEIPCPEFSKFLHTVIGYDYRWGGRTEWDEDTWRSYVSRPGLETWVAYVSGTPAGYFEIEKEPDGAVHIHNFGLLPQFVGQGLGGPLLTRAVERSWELGACRVYLRTCSHDHPHALQNYLARGFRIRETTQGPANPPLRSFWDSMTTACQNAPRATSK